jgi:hypothetical protein
LVDTEGFVLKAKVHSADIFDKDGIESLLERGWDRFPRLSHLWLDGGYKGKAKEWIEKVLGWTLEIVQHPPKIITPTTARVWEEEWAKEGVTIDWQKLLPPKGFRVLPKEVGGRAHILLVGPEQADEQGLRAADQHERGVHLRGDESPDGKTVSSLMRLFGQSL